MTFDIYVNILPLPALLDPAGKATLQGLHQLGFDGVTQVRIGKRIHLSIDAETAADAVELARRAAEKLLVNPVMETFTIERA